MKIYFAAAIRGGRQDSHRYQELIIFLSRHHQVLTEHIGNLQLTAHGENHLSDQQIRDRDVALLRKSDVVVAETTQPSLGVGYELGFAERIGKPVIILHQQGQTQLSAMISGTVFFNHINYYTTLAQAEKILTNQLAMVADQQ